MYPADSFRIMMGFEGRRPTSPREIANLGVGVEASRKGIAPEAAFTTRWFKASWNAYRCRIIETALEQDARGC